jgi:hypothetical protein
MFHVDEHARVAFYGGEVGDQRGAFLFVSPESGWLLYAIADDGTLPPGPDDPDPPPWAGWEHVSVSARKRLGRDRVQLRIPTWREMCFIKSVFWDPEDVAIQFHPRRSRYVNTNPNVLHLWRHTTIPIPEPATELI